VPLWQRLLVTLATIIFTSIIVGLVWRWLFNTSIPNYLSGVVGGISALPIWEFLKKIKITAR
jgi:glucose-6-phosphate-specific signal transduction histidine kinase